jgi:membrane protein implicated in regulation of membrane protease activity
MDRTTRIGVLVLGGLAVTALFVMALVLVLGVAFWIGLLLLAVLDVVELVWAYRALIRNRSKRAASVG